MHDFNLINICDNYNELLNLWKKFRVSDLNRHPKKLMAKISSIENELSGQYDVFFDDYFDENYFPFWTNEGAELRQEIETLINLTNDFLYTDNIDQQLKLLQKIIKLRSIEDIWLKKY